MTRDSFSLLPWGLLIGLSLLSLIALARVYRRRGDRWRSVADFWMARAVRAEDSLSEQIAIGAYRIPPHKVGDVFRDLMRPMGAPSTERDVEDAKAWRQRRALRGIDHKTSVVIDAENHAGNDSFAAKELLLLVLGGEEAA